MKQTMLLLAPLVITLVACGSSDPDPIFDIQTDTGVPDNSIDTALDTAVDTTPDNSFACTPGQWECFGDIWFLCAPDGTTRLDETTCPDSCDPVDGCVEDIVSCGAVDILFVIDNSGSMGSHQEALAAAFPGFVDLIFDNLASDTSLHVGITTTPFYAAGCSEAVVNCVSQSTPEEIEEHYIPPTESDLLTNGAQGQLFEYESLNYFEVNTSEDRGPLKAWFSAAAVAAGETGCSFEMPSAAAGYAAHPANDAYNAGFIRDDDAVLLIFVLSDEPDKSPEPVANYHSMLVSAKSTCGGDACIITAGLVAPCIEEVDNQLWLFLQSFGEPAITGDIDDTSVYDTVVGTALADVVAETCDEVVLI